MRSWNKDGFGGLAQLAGSLRQDSRCVAFADYCEKRSVGLRRPALERLRAFLGTFATWPVDAQRAWSQGLMEMSLAHREVHELICQPLREALVPIFEDWAEQDPSNASPCRWLGFLTHDTAWFEKALCRDPQDAYARWRGAEDLIWVAELACHHLPDYFIGDPAEAARSLGEAARILAPIADTPRGRLAVEDLNEAREQVDAWVAFVASGEASFEA